MPRPLIVFAHGAGAPSSSGWMQAWKHRLGELGAVVSFDYPYMQRGSRRPDPLPALVAAHRAAIEAALAEHDGTVVLAGKSMGSRVGCHVAASEDPLARRVKALICFGYPLRGQNGKVRDQVLLELDTPILFLQGTRDGLCPPELLEATRKRMHARNELHVVEGGDHSLVVSKGALKKANETQADVDARIAERIADFLNSVE